MQILANLPGMSSPRAMVSVAWSGLSAQRLGPLIWYSAHHSLRELGQSALRTFMSGKRDKPSMASQAVLVARPVQVGERIAQTSGPSRFLSQVGAGLRWTAASKFSFSLGWCSCCHTPSSQTPLGLQVGLCLFPLPLFRGNQSPWQPSSTHRGRQQWRLVPSALMAFLRFPKGGRDAALELFNLLTVTMFFL